MYSSNGLNKSKGKKSSSSYVKRNFKGKRIRKKSPRTIEYNKVIEKYGNLLETSVNTSDNPQTNKGAPSKIIPDKNNNDSYYDYIIDNIYSNNNSKTKKEKIRRRINNVDSAYDFVFKEKRKNERKRQKNISTSISNKREEMNNYYYYCNEDNDKKNMYSTFSNQVKRNKLNRTNISYKNECPKNKNEKNNFKKLGKMNTINYKNNSYNNIRTNMSKEKEVNKNNENNNEKEDINIKIKEKIILLLNLCKKFAHRFNRLFPLCEPNFISSNNNNNCIQELKNAILQYNNMIFNEEINKIFDIDTNEMYDYDLDLKEINEYKQKYEELKNKNEKLNTEIKRLKNIEYKYKWLKNTINELNKKIEILNNEIKYKDGVIKKYENKMNKISTKKFNGLYNDNNMSNQIKEQKEIANGDTKLIKDINIMTNNDTNIDNNNKLIITTNEEEKQGRLNYEIEELDKQIFNLKYKLKKIIP